VPSCVIGDTTFGREKLQVMGTKAIRVLRVTEALGDTPGLVILAFIRG
jgi:hypothetical protein